MMRPPLPPRGGAARLPRLLLLNAPSKLAAQTTRSLGSHGLGLALASPFQEAVTALLGEQSDFLYPRPDDGGVVPLFDKTYLRVNLEHGLRAGLESFDPDIAAALLFRKLHEELPYFACCVVEDANTSNTNHIRTLLNYIWTNKILTFDEVLWLWIDVEGLAPIPSPPDWATTNFRVIRLLLPATATPAEIHSAMEKLL